MGYPQSTLKYVWGGLAATDIWRTSLDFSIATSRDLTDEDCNGLATQADTFFTTFWNALRLQNTPGVGYSQVQVYYYKPGDTTASATGIRTSPSIPGTATAVTPYRTALVATKLTAFAGRRNRGRMYLPWTGANLNGATGQGTLVNITTIGAALKVMVDGMNAADNSLLGVTSQEACVTSATATSPGNPITGFRIDTLPDTQRRRTNKDAPTAFGNWVLA